MMPIEKNPTINNSDYEIEIVRISPKNQGVSIEYKYKGELPAYTKLVISEAETGDTVCEVDSFISENTIHADRILNDTVYIAEVIGYDYDKKPIMHSNKRLFETGYFPGQVINYIHPDDFTYAYSGKFPDSPNIIKLENGTYIACHGVMGWEGHNALCLVFVSKDYGKTWHYISRVERCCLAKLFRYGEKIYLLGTTDVKQGDLVLYESTDDCVSWSDPITLIEHTEDYTLRCSPIAHAEFKGRLWLYIDRRCYSDPAGFQTAVASVPVDADFADPNNWAFTEFIKYNPEWEGIEQEAWGAYMMEEGNLIVNRNMELIMLIRFNSHRYDIPEADPTNIKAIMFKVDTDNPTAPMEFVKAIPFNGTFSKTYIQYDEETDLYYAMLSRMTTNKIWQRNVLSLYSSYDLEHWKVERDLINLEDMEWYENNWESGMHYPTWFIEGDDIVAAVRSSLNHADNFHNSNAITFHRFRGFREKYNF